MNDFDKYFKIIYWVSGSSKEDVVFADSTEDAIRIIENKFKHFDDFAILCVAKLDWVLA